MKKTIFIILAIMILTISTSYADSNQTQYEDYALKLKEIGVFKGTNNGFELEREPTRIEACIMFVRLLGAEQIALEKKYEHPFTDLPEWANDYVGYLYHEGLTNGISQTTFGSKENVSAKSYMTFILRALGYKDSDGDFSWDKALDYAKDNKYISFYEFNELSEKVFLRDHVAKYSYLALKMKIKNEEKSLADKLVFHDMFDNKKIELIGLSRKENDFYHFTDVDNANTFQGYFINTYYKNENLYVNTGKQTKITKDIKDISNNFNDKKDISTIKEIYIWMNKNLHIGEGEKFGRTSQEILTSKMVTGCTDYGLAFIALTRAKGIPSVFVQTGRIDWIEDNVNSIARGIVGHILVEVYIDGKWYLVDSTSGKLYLNYDKDNFSLCDGYYVFAKSLDVWDSGVKNERENFNVMIDLFKKFDIDLYKNPKYNYINLMDGKEYESKDIITESTVIGLSAYILGSKESAELFDLQFTNMYNKKILASATNVRQSKLYSAARIVLLYVEGDEIPELITEMIPEIETTPDDYIMNTTRDGRRIILIKDKTQEELLNKIENLQIDFLDKDL